MRKLFAAFLAGLVVATSTSVFAESIDALFGQVKLVVDGKAVDKETLLYNGTTYVPLRAAAEVLGKEVAYDDATKTAYIDEVGTGRTFGEQGDLMTDTNSDVTKESNLEIFSKLDRDKINEYLGSKYSLVKTGFGDIPIEVRAAGPINNSYTHYDYYITIKYDSSLVHSVDRQYRMNIYNDMKDYMYNLAVDIIKKCPDVKFTGYYYVGSFKYPAINEGYSSIHDCTWTNYGNPGMTESYDDTIATDYITWISKPSLLYSTT